MMKSKTIIPECSDEVFQYCLGLEKEWRKSRQKFTAKELLTIFPEAKKIIPEKLKEWEEQKENLEDSIRIKLSVIKNSGADEGTKLFWREWFKLNDGEELLKIEKHIARLRVFKLLAKGRVLRGRLTDELVERAKEIPIENLIESRLKRSGNNLIGLCPLHNEKTPSFYIYRDENRWWCFGECSKGGDVISFVMLRYGFDFIEAVKWLNNT